MNIRKRSGNLSYVPRIYIYIYIYIEREREREREKQTKTNACICVFYGNLAFIYAYIDRKIARSSRDALFVEIFASAKRFGFQTFIKACKLLNLISYSP